ncbi:hypothetical protein RCH14_000965 [Massilia sp. MP_M2]|uniref:hypothetical protein n=1 Tax=Massilia sp. MP_M2 TaxID=3071713 RepID=UPI00319E7CA6
MDSIAGIPYSTVEFNQDGDRIKEPDIPVDARQVLIVSHGWKNDRGEADHMYRDLFKNFAAVHAEGTDGLAIIGVIWPSKKFDFDGDGMAAREEGDEGKDGDMRAAGLDDGSAAAVNAEIEREFSRFEEFYADAGKEKQLAALREALPQLEQPAAKKAFVIGLRELLGTPDETSRLDGSEFFFELDDPQAIFTNASGESAEVDDAPNGGVGDVTGQGLGSAFKKIGNAVSSLLNVTTYYEMKKRAGTVGTLGLAPLIMELAQRASIERIHLIGHSFGARLVSAAAMHVETPKLHSLFLLQAAFSHSGFAPFGYFKDVVEKSRVSGPIVITHTPNDKAVGKAYAIASRIVKDFANELGDANDKYGGLGRNGAVNVDSKYVAPACKALLASGSAYDLQMGLIHNLESSAFIRNHGDVEGREVAWAISRGVALA